jgi:hypothetical protein
MLNYRKRIADQMLKERLEAKGAVLIEGPKWCGKTTTALQIAKSVIYLQDPTKKEQYLHLSNIAPDLLLEGENPRLIDEWQLTPKIWDAIRFEVDQRDSFGNFIMTGSTVPAADMSRSHSGTGRIGKMMMRPMSLYESGDSNATVSLTELFDGHTDIAEKNYLSITDVAYLICRGGWPKAVGQSEKIALRQAYDYYDAVVEVDIAEADGVRRNPNRVKRFMRSYSRFIASDGKYTQIRSDMAVNDAEMLENDTIASYVNALQRIFVIEELEAWSPNLRSRTAIRSTNTRHFVDPSIAVASLGIGPNDLLSDIRTMGILFESMCIRDLRVFADVLDGTVYHYRDKTGLECDAVIHLRNGKYGLIEIKLGDSLVEEAAGNLLKLKQKIDTDKMREPSFLLVITGTGYAYQRADGVCVVPIGCLFSGETMV